MGEPLDLVPAAEPRPVGAAKERRAQPRFPIMLKGTLELVGVSGAGAMDVVSSDMSLSGVLLHTNHAEALSPNDVVQLTFAPLLDGEPVRLRARVVWLRKDLAPAFGACSFGALFFGAAEADIRRLLDVARAADALKLISEPY